MITRRIKLRKFSALGIGFGVASLALACGNDNAADPSDGDDINPPVQTVEDPCEENPYIAGCDQGQSLAPPGGDDDDDDDDDTVTGPRERTPQELARDAAQNILRTNCGGCHGTQLTLANSQGGMNYIDDMLKLAENDKITPLSAESSLVIQRMRNGSMPPSGAGSRVSGPDIDIVANYINNEDFWPDAPKVVCDDNPPASFDELYSDVAEDLQDQEADDAPFIRYVSIRNRIAAGVCANTSLDLDRQALTKMVNMLSTETTAYIPEPVDKDETLFRIDIRELGWDREVNVDGEPFTDVWEAIIDANTYAVPFVGDQADDARADAQTDVPVMFLDSMLNVATIGNLYYAAINVDVAQTLDDFIINVLDIDVQANLDDEELIRAGTTQSDISRQDRLIEGHEINARQGVFYQSFDFNDVQNESIFQDPFGFNEGGREAIFTLPNGMLAYLIADENGLLVQDSDILFDSSQDNYRAVTSVSCSNCHVGGLIPVEDEVREVVLDNALNLIQDGTLNQEQLEQLEAVYLKPDAFEARLASDSDRFYLSALRDAKLPVGGAEPVSTIFGRFDLDMKAKIAAADLGVSEEVFLDNINELDPALGVLKRGVIDRDDFTALYVASLCVLSGVNENRPDDAICAQAIADLDL